VPEPTKNKWKKRGEQTEKLKRLDRQFVKGDGGKQKIGKALGERREEVIKKKKVSSKTGTNNGRLLKAKPSIDEGELQANMRSNQLWRFKKAGTKKTEEKKQKGETGEKEGGREGLTHADCNSGGLRKKMEQKEDKEKG